MMKSNFSVRCTTNETQDKSSEKFLPASENSIGSSANEIIPDFLFKNNLGTNWNRRCTGIKRNGHFFHVHNCSVKFVRGKCCAQGRNGDPSAGVNWNGREDNPKGYCGNCYTGPPDPIN